VIVFIVAPPGSPTIIAPTFIVEGNTVTLTCTSEGGSPAPTVKWYRGSNNGQLVDETSTTSNGKTTNSYSFVADPTHHLSVYECQVDNNVLQNPLTTTWFFQVYSMYINKYFIINKYVITALYYCNKENTILNRESWNKTPVLILLDSIYNSTELDRSLIYRVRISMQVLYWIECFNWTTDVCSKDLGYRIDTNLKWKLF
jgi:hypothetical protein